MVKDVTSTVKYIGVDDTNLDLFESQYYLPAGMAYNSYVILDEKVAIMDTVLFTTWNQTILHSFRKYWKIILNV